MKLLKFHYWTLSVEVQQTNFLCFYAVTFVTFIYRAAFRALLCQRCSLCVYRERCMIFHRDLLFRESDKYTFTCLNTSMFDLGMSFYNFTLWRL